MGSLLHLLIVLEIYVILSMSLNLIAGYTGLFSIAHAAFYGVGAYVAALMALKMHSPFLANILCAIILGGLLGALVGFPSLRIRDDYFVIATLGFQIITFSVLNNFVSFTGGADGLRNIPKLTIFGVNISEDYGFPILGGILCVLTFWLARRIVRSPFGRVLKAIREDEVFTQAAGKNVATYKVLIFVIGAGLAAMAGVMNAYYISFIDPTSFTVMESIFIISIVIIGGAGSLWGPVLGATVLIFLPELLRRIGLPSAVAANLRQILYGGALVAFMMWRPQGFFGGYAFQNRKTRE